MDTNHETKKLFMYAILCLSLAVGLSSGVFSNYFKDVFAVDSVQRGLLELSLIHIYHGGDRRDLKGTEKELETQGEEIPEGSAAAVQRACGKSHEGRIPGVLRE